MSQYLLINRIQVQGANAVAGFTWGFPAITHFLGFAHNLSRKIRKHNGFSDIRLSGCAVIAHDHQVHTYGYNQFIQSKNPAYQFGEDPKNKVGSPPIIEEGKMNMNVSLLISCEGNVGNRKGEFTEWLDHVCKRQRLAGGSIFEVGGIELFTVDDEDNRGNLRRLIRKLLPGFVLQDRSQYLEDHFHALKDEKSEVEAELFDAWLDFIALKQKARPESNLIDKHLLQQAESFPQQEDSQDLLVAWQKHLEQPYDQNTVPNTLNDYFSTFTENTSNKKVLAQWQTYCMPNEKTDAVWEYVKKPYPGFLVPIMVGYKAISKVYSNDEVANTRDNRTKDKPGTDVCFVESVHSIGEWQGVHRIRSEKALRQSLWHYGDYQEHWYVCTQGVPSPESEVTDNHHQNPEDDFFD